MSVPDSPRDMEPERYELQEVTLREGGGASRREFLKVFGGGVVVVLVTRDPLAVPRLGAGARGLRARLDTGAADAADGPEAIGAWLHIDGHGGITVFTGKVEIGQGIRTSLAQELAEELRVPLAAVRMVMGDTELVPFDMGTFGSRSTPQMGTQLRKVGAAARELLLGLAAERWQVDRATLTAADGRVSDGHGRALGYGELTAGRRLTEVVREDTVLTPAPRWSVAGHATGDVNARDVVTGRHRYPSDMVLPNMLYGKVLRPPSIGAALGSVDASGARAVHDVVVVHDGDFVGVAAHNAYEAEAALATIRAEWTPSAGPQPSSTDLFDYLRHTPPKTGAGRESEGFRGSEPFIKGDVDAALGKAAHRLTRRYTVAYIAHVPLEPRAALAEWSRDAAGERLTVWTGTQRPFAVREQLASAFGLKLDRVRVIMPDMGSGYGGKHTGECAVEAARLAKAAGRPVHLRWTREEEFRWAYFRPAGVIDVTAGIAADGTVTAWTFDNYNSGAAAIRPWYAIANQRVQFHPTDYPLRQGSYRGLAATANHFARETHVDELAQLAGMDPLAFRLKNIEDPRLAAAFQAAADRFGWGKAVPAGHGVGIGGGFEKGGYVATCAEVAVDTSSGGVRIVRAVTAFDCGAVINPDGLKHQVTGALIQGIGGALFEAIDFDHGVIRNPHLAQYRVPRFGDVPAMDVVLLDRKDEPSFGAGETPIMGLAPAVGAGIFQATGVRPRSLPMARGGLQLEATPQ
jgi:nicotinate dehydrogenase subunit B